MNSPERPFWIAAMDSEMSSHRKANTFERVRLPKGRKAIGSKWVYKTKRGPNGEIVKYKARLVAKGCSQRYGVDYEETYAPVC